MNRKQVSLSVDTLDLLKGKILKSAFEGKLVPQIEGEPEALQVGKATEEMPFRIPKKWKWIRLDSLTDYIQRGKSPKYSEVKKIPVISQKCNQWSGFEIDKARFIDPDTISKYSEERKLQDLDLLWNSTGTGTIGRVALYESKLNPFDTAVADSHVTVVRVDKELMLPKFLYWFLRSPFVQQSIESLAGGSTNQKELATRTIKNVLVPVPPLEEQKRIVEKVKCLFSKIDVIQKSIDEVSQLGASLEKQLLQSSISGKLVPQLDEELEVEQIGDAPEEVPFEIPEKWKWVRLESLGTLFSGKTPKADELTSSGNIPYFKISDMNSSENQKYMRHTEHYLKTTPKKIFKAGSIIFPKNGGAVFTNKRRFLVRDSIVDLNTGGFYPNKNYLDESYAFLLLSSIDFREISKGTALPTIDSSKLKSYLVPLPPLGEQRRIVEKFEKLMLEIQKLK